jgi:hypothetical protein
MHRPGPCVRCLFPVPFPSRTVKGATERPGARSPTFAAGSSLPYPCPAAQVYTSAKRPVSASQYTTRFPPIGTGFARIRCTVLVLLDTSALVVENAVFPERNGILTG